MRRRKTPQRNFERWSPNKKPAGASGYSAGTGAYSYTRMTCIYMNETYIHIDMTCIHMNINRSYYRISLLYNKLWARVKAGGLWAGN